MSNTQKISSCGFQPYSYRDFTKQLRQLLQDRYTWDGDGFTILKELIQNANDAGATSLHLGWSPPLFDAPSASIAPGHPPTSASSQAPHPLLTVPALFAVNNGPLRASDAINITRLGSNSKAGEASSAGRFGLGLKSVFHLCEAFFYLAQPFEEHASLCSIFNPWSPPRGADEVGPYEHWDFDPDGNVAKSVEMAIRSRLAPIFAKTSPSFCLWIPLRDDRVLKGDALVKRNLSGLQLGCILGEPTLHVRLAELLPLLHGLREISVWIPNSKAVIERRFAVSVEPSATRPTKLPEPDGERLPPERQTNFSGRVIVSNFGNNAETACEFVGAEAIVIRDSIQELWRNKNWPSDESLDPVTNKWRDEPHRVKLIPHGALRFMATPKVKGTGKVSMHWCVFLPLGKSDGDEHLEVEAAISADVSVFLHGYFFIDAGRTCHVKSALDATDSRHLDAESLQKSWNTTIEREAIWPQFLEALAAFVSQLKWDERQVEKLTLAILAMLTRIAGSNTSSVLPIVCRAKQWLYLLKPPTESNSALGSWTLKTANAAVHDIPRPTAPIALYDLLPGIAAVGSDRALTLACCPRISANETNPWSWTALKKVVGSVEPSVLFMSYEHLEYFAQFLEHCANSEDQKLAVGEALWPLLKKAFQDDSLTLQRIEELGDKLRRVLEYVPEEHRLVLNWASSERRGANAAFRLIANDECDLLPIPSSVRPTIGRDSKTIASQIVVRVLRAIEDASLDSTLQADVVGDLLKRANLDRETLWQSLNDVRLLVVYERGQKQPTRKTWMELSEHKRRRLVFCDQAGLTQQLQAALGDADSVWRIDPDFAAKVLGDKHGLPDCSARECAAVLAPSRHANAVHFGGAALGAWEARRELLKRLAGTIGTGTTGDQERLKDACRLLIHGRSQDADFNAALFLAADRHFDALAEKLVLHVLAKRHEEWRILTGESAAWVVEEGLTPLHQKHLDFYPLVFSEPTVLDLLEKAKTDQLNGLDISKEEYTKLLSAVHTSRNELLKRLPIHPVIKGKQRIAIQSDDSLQVFWDDGYELDGDLTESITLLALDKRDKRVADRQRELAPVLDRAQALRLALKSPQPEKHWSAILNAIEKSAELLPDDIIADLRAKKWFPTRFGARGRDDLICLTLTDCSEPSKLPEEFKQEVTRLVEASNGAWIADWMLDEKLLKELSRGSQAAFQRLVEWGVLANETESLQQLGYLIGQDKQHHIGYMPFDLFQDWLDIEWDSDVMPCHQLLQVMRDCFGIERTFDPGTAEVRVPIADCERVVCVLNFLGKHHNQARTRDSKDRTVRIFRRYLEFLLNHQEFKSTSQLAAVPLLSRAGTWESPAELCLPTDGIAAKHILSDDFVDLLGPVCGQASDAIVALWAQPIPPLSGFEQLAATSQSSALLLENYFRSWESHVPHDVIGGFVSLLGGNPAVEQLASRYLGKRSLDETRRNLRVSPSPFGKRHIRMPDVTFDISIVHGDTELMTNLMGQRFRAALTDGNDCVLVGWGDGRNFDVHQKGSQWHIGIRLRAVDFSATNNSSNASQLLSHAAALLLDEVFAIQQHSIPDLVNETFADLQASDQLEIRVTQQLILEDAEFMLKQLGLHTDELLGPVISRQTRFKKLRAERSHNQKRFGRPASWTEDEIDDEQNEANQNLRRLLEDESSGGPPRILSAVCQRIQGHNQYNPAAVPFELFQNADDAAVDRTQLLPSNLSANSIDYFIGPNTLAVRHFGRCVNQVPPGCAAADSKHADDLRNMLTLWLSNKDSASRDEESVELTGKFGLGFKSVFLVSDKPQLLSGRIGCEIVGGVFPRYLDLEQRRRFDRFIHDLADERKREVTVIELPLRNTIVENGAGAIVSRFREMAHLLVVFARQIRTIQLTDEETSKKHETSWQDQPISGLANCFKGTLRSLPVLPLEVAQGEVSETDNASAHRALVLRTSQQSGALLFVHDGRQFKMLPKEVPTLWVTAPTRESLDVGFALNARFSLDPGRSWLGSESPENEDIADDMGRELGQHLVAIRDLQEKGNWAQFIENIGFDRDANEYEFWSSLWKMLGSAIAKLDETAPSSGLLRQMFWDAEIGAARHLYSRKNVLPNGLPGELQSLTSLSVLRYEITGSLAHKDVLPKVVQWEGWKKKLICPAQCVVRDILQVLDKFKVRPAHLIQASVVSLETALRWECEFDACLSRERAAGIAEVLFNKPVTEVLIPSSPAWEEVRKALADFQFPDGNGTGRAPKELIASSIPPHCEVDGHRDLADEVLIARFAPSERVLNGGFLAGTSSTGCLRLFVQCRGDHRPPAFELATWAISARGAEHRNAVTHYLAEGKRRDDLTEELRSREAEVRVSWLAGLVGTNVLQTANERAEEITGQIQRYEATHARKEQSADILRRILEWWRDPRRPSIEPRRYGLFCPETHGLLKRDYDSRDIEQRKSWMRLFLMGITHTMGRTTSSQNTGFLDRCERHGWLDEFIDPDGSPDRWSRLLHDYLSEQIDTSEYLHWMRQFVGIFAMAERLDEYVESFLSIERKVDRFSLKSITCPSSSHESPADAPPVARILGMGACFIIRELLRLKVLTNCIAWEHAFVPKGEVRGMLQNLGCTFSSKPEGPWMWSQEIWIFLREKLGSDNDDALFEHGFDLPFLLLAHKDNAGKRHELLEVEWQYDENEEVQEEDW